MPNASQVNLDEVDQTFSPSEVPVGISAVLGVFKRGPVNDPDTIITGWNQFAALFGGIVPGSDDGLLVQRAINRGSQLRVINIRHYTNIEEANTLTAIVASPANTKNLQYSAVLITANLLTITINGTVFTQVFTTNSDNTFQLMVAQILASAALADIISGAWYMGAGTNQIVVTPATGVALVITSAVTLGASQAAATITSVNTIANSTGTALFSLAPLYPGQDYNNLLISILPASNGNANYFNIQIQHLTDPTVQTELYQNLTIIGSPTVANSNYLQPIVNGSLLVEVTYNNLSALAAPIVPVPMYLKMDTGSDGAAVVDSDFIGNQASQTGIWCLDPYDDFFYTGVVNASGYDAAVSAALSAYAQTRQDHCFMCHIDNSYNTANALTAFRQSTGINSSYTAFWCGGVMIVDPFTNAIRGASELGDVLGAAAYCDENFGMWWSFSGTRRGTILNALGVVNNFGLANQYALRNQLANYQINCAISKGGIQSLSGNFTGQISNSTLSFLNVRRMLLYVKSILGPIYDSYIEEPNDPTTWLAIYNEVKPEMKTLKNLRAIADWTYQGDQFVTDVNDVVINTVPNVQNGIYLANLYVEDIVSLQQIQVNIILTDSGVSFEENLTSSIGTSTNQ